MKRPATLSVDKVAPCIHIIAAHVTDTAERLEPSRLRNFIAALFAAERIFVMGAGRSGLVARAFAMRLMHLGFTVYVVGETTTPAVRKEDAVIAISGSGRTKSVMGLGKLAKELGAKLLLVSSEPSSPLGRMADATIVVKGRGQSTIGDYMERHMKGEYSSMAPLGTLFEITALIVLDAVIAQLMELTGASEVELKKRHAVLE